MVDRHRVDHHGGGGELPRPLHLTLHPGDLLHPDLAHFHLRDICEAYQGMHGSTPAHAHKLITF